MKHIKRFNDYKEDEKLDILEKFAYITDIESHSYGKGTNIKSYRLFSDDNYINESVMDDIKSYVKKGLLTATLLTSLLGNSAYGQTQKAEDILAMIRARQKQ